MRVLKQVSGVLIVLSIAVLFASCTTAGGGKKKKDASEGEDGADAADAADATSDPCKNGSQDGDETDVDCGGVCGPCADGKSCTLATDCVSTKCSVTYVCVTAACSNGEMDGDETGIDCGGECLFCPGDKCSQNEQCTTGFCKTGVCDTPSCTDGQKNGAETGVDCGGDCGPCADGLGCLLDTGCTSGFCNASKLCATPKCTDGEKNADETDIDCGGGCEKCGDGKACGDKDDCTSAKCDGGKCKSLAGTCGNGKKDGDESDSDCGGSCNGCGFDGACKGEADCLSGICTADVCTAPASCSDATLTPGETDTDCGGANCKPCGLDQGCQTHEDCLSIACVFGKCKEPACDDKSANGDETDLDCGGKDCPDCADGLKCTTGEDCLGGNCTGGFCGSCSDKTKNGNETDTDCGGACDPCVTGKACVEDVDCQSADCGDGTCVSCEDKKLNGNESDVDCGGGCSPCADNKACTVMDDCLGGACGNGKCCTANACGTCGAEPPETCNGLDDDCDNDTDEGLSTELCTTQNGVCKGSVATCEGLSGWVCDDALYASFAKGSWEKAEASCDKLDNDCDGKTDEDNCAACAGKLVENKDLITGQYDDALVGWEFMTTFQGTPTLICSAQKSGGSKRDALMVTPTDSQVVATDVVNGGGIATDGTTVFFAFRQDVSFNNYFAVGRYTSLGGFDSWLNLETDVPAGNHETPLAYGAGGLASAHVGYVNGSYNMYSNTTDKAAFDGAWTEDLIVKHFDSSVAVKVDSTGVAHYLYVLDGPVSQGGELAHWTNTDGPEVVGDKAGPPDLAIAADDTLLAGFWNNKTITFRRKPAGEDWEPAVPVATNITSNAVAVAAGESGVAYVAWVVGTKVSLARVEAGVAKTIATRTLANGSDFVRKIEIETLTHGAVQIVAHVDGFTGDIFAFASTCEGYGDSDTACVPACAGKTCGDNGCGGTCGTCLATQSCNAASKCVACTPACSGKVCGDNGCGGTCGTCPGGTTCDANGKCAGGAACGADPALTCQGKCGGTGVGGCYCDDACVGNNDCCPDLAACCDGPCTPNCSGKVCGDDGCGTPCGACTGGKVCEAGACKTPAAGPFGLPAGCILNTVGTECNPITNAQCTTAGAACDVGGDGGTQCFPPPNDAAKGAACSNSEGPYCAGTLHCDAGTSKCRSFCCSSSDCAFGKACTPLSETYGTIGTCPP